MSLKNCPECGKTTTHVIDSRPNEDYTRRRMACKSCGARFSTREYREEFFTDFDRMQKIERFEESFRVLLNAYVKSLTPEEMEKFIEVVMTI